MKTMLINFLVTAAAVACVLAAYVWYNKKQSEQYVQAAFIVQGLQAATMAKQFVHEYYEMRGRWPTTNEEAGLPAPDRFMGQSLKDLAIGHGGVITLRYNSSTGIDNGTIRIIPDSSNPALGVQWQCVTSSYAQIASFAPQCKYEG